MGVPDLDKQTRGRLAALLDSADDVIEFDNRRNNPVGLRQTANSYVQTIPDGACRVLELDGDTTPDIYLHPESNAVTFVYR
ncbi:MAG: hypothetical protein ABEI57_00635 [Halapricum sp.]